MPRMSAVSPPGTFSPKPPFPAKRSALRTVPLNRECRREMTIMAALCAYIRERCGEPIHMADLVKISGYSERRLFSLFHERIGLTPGNYITRCRIDRAKERIAASSHPRLLDIALSCGFSSASHFSAVFRKYVGKSPRAYLNRNE